MLINGQAGDKNSQVKIDPRETGETQRNTEEAELFHREISDALRDCHVGFEAGTACLDPALSLRSLLGGNRRVFG